MKLKSLAAAVSVLALASTAQAAGFVNGGFEDGNTNGWTTGGGCRSSVLNPSLNAASFVPGGSLYNVTSGCSLPNANTPASHSEIIGTSYVDPNLGALLGSTVYSGNNSYRVEDTLFGGFASVARQTVLNYTDTDIFFAWKSVLLGAHGVNDAATMIIELKDLTTGAVLITREYNAASGGGGVDPRFTNSGGIFYTADWQIEQLTIGAALQGHDFELSVIGSDCQPTGHYGYVYLDGFGAVIPPPGVPEPGSLGLVGAALLAAVAVRRRKSV